MTVALLALAIVVLSMRLVYGWRFGYKSALYQPMRYVEGKRILNVLSVLLVLLAGFSTAISASELSWQACTSAASVQPRFGTVFDSPRPKKHQRTLLGYIRGTPHIFLLQGGWLAFDLPMTCWGNRAARSSYR